MSTIPLAGRAALPLALLLALPACSAFGGDGPQPVGDLVLTGVVASVQHSATASGLLVDPPEGTACGIRATADAGTRVYRRTPRGLEALSGAGALAVGDRVEVYVDGPVAESCPVQGRASTLVLVG